jgi:hypothetical protein
VIPVKLNEPVISLFIERLNRRARMMCGGKDAGKGGLYPGAAHPESVPAPEAPAKPLCMPTGTSHGRLLPRPDILAVTASGGPFIRDVQAPPLTITPDPKPVHEKRTVTPNRDPQPPASNRVSGSPE